MHDDRSPMSRRDAVKTAATALMGVAGAPMVNLGRFAVVRGSATEYSERAVRLVRESTVVDMLNQFKYPWFKRDGQSVIGQWLTRPGQFTAADAARYQTSGINVFALGLGAADYEQGVQFFAEWNGFIAQYPQWLARIDQVADIGRAKASGHVGLLLSLQNSVHFRHADDVDYFFGLGQRASQLTYNTRNLIGNGAFERRDDGLSDFGVTIVQRMNKVGMAVDVSHCGDRTTLDACEASTKPVLFTHGNCRALIPHLGRAKSDEAIRRMARGGGVMGITFIRIMVRDREPTTVEHLLDHFDHVVRLVGVEHVGIGSDFDLDGLDAIPEERDKLHAELDPRYKVRERSEIEGVDHPKRVYDLTEGLIRRRYSDESIRLVLGGNFVRALGEIWGG